jgi:SAM-dependent methyltransferase
MTDARVFWDREIIEQQFGGWLDHLHVRHYVNQLIGGERMMWPVEWFEHWLGGRTFERALSVGCGGGGFERGLVERGLCKRVDAFDASITSLHLARTAAKDAGLGDRIHYFAADFNEPVLRGQYDAVFFQQSAHHVAKLEKLDRAILRALKPNGLVYMDEYVGPARTDWTDELIAHQRALYASLPSETRRFDRLSYPVMQDDPSEAVRSSEIETQLRIGFRIVAERPYGGTLLSLVFPCLYGDRVTDDLVEKLVDEERRFLAAGGPSYYKLIVATPKRGFARIAANVDYWLTPKLKRIGRELKSRLK